MALTPEEKADILFKKSLGKIATNTSFSFFEESINGRISVYTTQIWAQSDLIPQNAPSLLPGEVSGVVQYFEDLALTEIDGSPGSYYNAQLRDAIPFNFGGGSYNYVVKDALGEVIPFGLNDWLIDNDGGTLTFFGGWPASYTEPPSVTFYKYVGTKGLGSAGSTGLAGFTGLQGITGIQGIGATGVSEPLTVFGTEIVSGVSELEFDITTGFIVSGISPTRAKISLDSHFKTIHVPGQPNIVAKGVDELTIAPASGSGLIITTHPTDPKTITLSATGIGGTGIQGVTGIQGGTGVPGITGSQGSTGIQGIPGLFNGNIILASGINEIVVSLPQSYSDLAYSASTQIVNETNPDALFYLNIIKEKSLDQFTVEFSSNIVGSGYVLSWITKGSF